MAVKHNKQAGFSLIELVVFIVVLGVSLGGIMLAINQSVSRSADPMTAIRAVELGQAYLDEILPMRFDENSAQGGSPRCNENPLILACTTLAGFGPDAGPETRALFDDVDDYNGLDESPPQDANGIARAGYANYQVQVAVAYAGADIGLAANDAKRVTVTVTAPDNQNHVFSAYRVNF